MSSVTADIVAMAGAHDTQLSASDPQPMKCARHNPAHVRYRRQRKSLPSSPADGGKTQAMEQYKHTSGGPSYKML